ncbi:MAG: hypothetical protein O3C57_02490, partial [Verrucomicrobia bacterium]|nr:hypothetical protein [Verrucomicrobiota bacterium]
MKPSGLPARAAAANETRRQHETHNDPAIAALSVALTATASEELRPLMVGQQIPDLTLKDADGEGVNLRTTAK